MARDICCLRATLAPGPGRPPDNDDRKSPRARGRRARLGRATRARHPHQLSHSRAALCSRPRSPCAPVARHWPFGVGPFDVRHYTLDVGRYTLDVRRSTFDIRHSTLDARRPKSERPPGATGDRRQSAPAGAQITRTKWSQFTCCSRVNLRAARRAPQLAWRIGRADKEIDHKAGW